MRLDLWVLDELGVARVPFEWFVERWLSFAVVVSEYGLVEVYTTVPLSVEVYEKRRSWSRYQRDVAVVVGEYAFLVEGRELGNRYWVETSVVRGWEPNGEWRRTDRGVAVVRVGSLVWPRWLGVLYNIDTIDEAPPELTVPSSYWGLDWVVTRYAGAGRPDAELVIEFAPRVRVRRGRVADVDRGHTIAGLEDLERIGDERRGSGTVRCIVDVGAETSFWFIAPGMVRPLRIRLLEEGEEVSTVEPGEAPLICVAAIARLGFPNPWP